MAKGSVWLVRCGVALALAIGAPSAVAQDATPPAAPAEADPAKARAKVHFERGITAYKEGRYKDAIDAFLDAHREYPSPTLSFNTARAYEKMGDSAGALRFYREYLRQSPQASDKPAVDARISELEGKLRARGVQQVTVLSQPEGATVILDGRPVGVTPWTGEILPGGHRLRLRREGFQDGRQEFTLLPHRALDVTLTLERAEEQAVAPTTAPGVMTAAPPEADSSDAATIGVPTWIVLGAGVAALGTAAVFEVLRGQSEEDVKSEETQVARHDAHDTMESRQTTARVFAGVGAAALIAGGVLLYFDLSSEPAKTSAGGFGFGCDAEGCAARVEGRF